MKIHNLGFPRIGKHRELKFSLEAFWQEKITEQTLEHTAQSLRQQHWQTQAEQGIELLPVGDFAFYDHVLNTTLMLGLSPKRFANEQSVLATEFAIARGHQSECHSCAASDMTKWFDTNYHYLVPELDDAIDVQLNAERLLAQVKEAQHSGYQVKPVILGPLTYLYLSDYQGENKLALLDKLIPAYQQLLELLATHNCQWLQIDEPILSLELTSDWLLAFEKSYQQLANASIKLLLATYFGSVDHHLTTIAKLPINGVHLDTVSEDFDWQKVLPALPSHWVVSLGIIDGRNIWKADLVSIYQRLLPWYHLLGNKLWLAPSCSLLHCPVDLSLEQKLDKELKSWLAFAVQKCEELSLLKQALVSGCIDAISRYTAPVINKLTSEQLNNSNVKQRVKNLKASDFTRTQPYQQRKLIQQQQLNLPILPTTTIGSFPQTGDIRALRAQLKSGALSLSEYQRAIKHEIAKVIEKQIAIGLDVLVHGEPERNDMVEYFGELLSGCAISEFAWVQSYGSRCVKPPIIFGDVNRPKPMTVEWIRYAQSLTDKPVKAMLTGPITMLSWSFIRSDIPRSTIANQLALAIKDEVNDLVTAGIDIIQIDEPAIKEAMPLKASAQATYCDWATKAFRLCASSTPARTQIHSHMCYSEFNDILPAIIALDADVLTIETSRSNMALLKVFDDTPYPNDLGPGVYDIHSPNIPSCQWIKQLVNKAQQTIPVERLWINPDCGLKTRGWQETEFALINMVKAAQQLRQQFTVQQTPEPVLATEH